jgi:proliferating cell nuclear antigen PCNA
MKMTEMNGSKSLLIDIKLYAKNFTKFYVNKDILHVAISIQTLHKHISSLGKDDVLNLYISNDNRNNLIVERENSNKLEITHDEIKMIKSNNQEIEIGTLSCDAVITISAHEFHKKCKEMINCVGDDAEMEIRCMREKISFSCIGECSKRITTLSTLGPNGEKGIVKIHFSGDYKKDMVQGIYKLKPITSFSKMISLSDYIEIFMRNDKPLFIQYDVANLGKIILCLIPIVEKPKNSNEKNDEDDLNDPDYSDSDPDIGDMGIYDE